MPNATPARAQLWPLEKTITKIEEQLASLQPMKGRPYAEQSAQLEEWKQTSFYIFKQSFGEDSQQMRNLGFAAHKGVMRIGGVSPWVAQSNYEQRVDAYEIALKAALQTARMELPESPLSGVYAAGDPYAFYVDLKGLVAGAQKTLYLADAYLDQGLFDLYMHDIPSTIALRILSNKVSSPVLGAAQLFAQRHSHFELRSTTGFHDRALFIDDRCWVLGQSLKDAAVKKPTYIVETTATLMSGIYESLWNAATTLVKS